MPARETTVDRRVGAEETLAHPKAKDGLASSGETTTMAKAVVAIRAHTVERQGEDSSMAEAMVAIKALGGGTEAHRSPVQRIA